MSNTLLTIMVAVLGSQAIFTFLQFMISRMDIKKADPYAKQHDLELIKNAQMVWMQGELDKLMTRYINEEKITPYQFKHIQSMVKAYEGLGGDGYIHELYNQTCDIIGPEGKDVK